MRTTAAWILAAILLAGCQATKAPPSDPVPADPDGAVAELRDAWFSAPADRLHSGYPTERGGKTRSRAMLRRQAENLVFRHPRHVDARMLCAIMAYEAGDPVEAGRHLDHVLRLDPATPDAALLRARIAVESGNPILAERLLSEQVNLRPDHAGLRETLASVRFLDGDLDGAESALAEAERLGADPARMAYNRGLLAEHRGNSAAAADHYNNALSLRPHWTLAKERLTGLREQVPPSAGGVLSGKVPVDGEFAPVPMDLAGEVASGGRPDGVFSEMPLPANR